jgi:hypothetical protein
MQTCGPLTAWVSTGAVLDAAALVAIWSLLDFIGPHQYNTESWLVGAGLVAVPWLVHVVALPALFRIDKIGLLMAARTAGFAALAAMLFPIVGMAVFLLLGMPLLEIVSLVRGESAVAAAMPPTLLDRMIDGCLWTFIATIVGAAIGCWVHVVRPGGTANNLAARSHSRPNMRSDVMGGTIAAFLAFSGMFAAIPFGIFTRSVVIPKEWLHDTLFLPPQLPACLVIGVLALLPHLVLTGRDLLGARPHKDQARADHPSTGNARATDAAPFEISGP